MMVEQNSGGGGSNKRRDGLFDADTVFTGLYRVLIDILKPSLKRNDPIVAL